MLSSSVYLPFPVGEKDLPLGRAFQVCGFGFFFPSVQHQILSFPISCHPVAWDAGLVEAHCYIKCSSTLTLGPQGQFSLTKGSGLLLSHRVKQDCQEILGIVAVTSKRNFFSLSPPGYLI